jgi:hypothetical protein
MNSHTQANYLVESTFTEIAPGTSAGEPSSRIAAERYGVFRVAVWFAGREKKCRSLTSFGMTAWASNTATLKLDFMRVTP